MAWLLYRATFIVDSVLRQYLGITEQRSCSQALAVNRRREFHLDPPAGYPQAAWLQGLDRESLSVRAVEGKGGLSLSEALLQEAIVAASEIRKHMEDGSSTARGGPWCQR